MKYLAVFDNGSKCSHRAKNENEAREWIRLYMAEEMPGANIVSITPIRESLIYRVKKQWKNWAWGKGHFSIGNLTVYGDNAMHWAVNFWTDRWGYICWRPTTGKGKSKNDWYLYTSRNGTPWARTWGIGPALKYREVTRKGAMSD